MHLTKQGKIRFKLTFLTLEMKLMFWYHIVCKWCVILVFTISCEGRPKNLLKEHIDEVL